MQLLGIIFLPKGQSAFTVFKKLEDELERALSCNQCNHALDS